MRNNLLYRMSDTLSMGIFGYTMDTSCIYPNRECALRDISCKVTDNKLLYFSRVNLSAMHSRSVIPIKGESVYNDNDRTLHSVSIDATGDMRSRSSCPPNKPIPYILLNMIEKNKNE